MEKSDIWEIRQAPGANSRDYDVHPKDAPASAGKIARVFGREGLGDLAIKRARRIAAAPQMLAAIEALLAVAPKNADCPDDPEFAAAWALARDAVAQARGQS